ncbi:MAG: alpha/beta hydrolase [Caulobacteraceae bacterium]|nr:alpha/beta hydrolase [Caulobacteraceae bacterium]
MPTATRSWPTTPAAIHAAPSTARRRSSSSTFTATTPRLIETLGGEPANVFGSSGGAQIGLNLAAQHSGRVRTLVAHEPPCVRLLPDPSEALSNNQAVYDTYRHEGVGPAMQRFMAMAGMGGGSRDAASPSDLPLEAGETFARIGKNMDYFLAHGLMPISLFVPDVDALRAGPTRVVVGVGETSGGQLAHRTAVALAGRLGTQPVTFPGDHGGYGSHPGAFAESLHRVFSGSA